MRVPVLSDLEVYSIITNITDEGYDFYYCHRLDTWEREHLYDNSVTGADFIGGLGLENITIPKTTYAIFVASDVKNPIGGYFDLLKLRIQVLTEWMSEMGFRLKPAPELAVYHWMPRNERNVQIWLPITLSLPTV